MTDNVAFDRLEAPVDDIVLGYLKGRFYRRKFKEYDHFLDQFFSILQEMLIFNTNGTHTTCMFMYVCIQGNWETGSKNLPPLVSLRSFNLSKMG